MLIPMKVSSLTVDPFTNMPVVVLSDGDGRRTVPIWIGLVEASAIATELEQIHLARPMTHDLMKTLLESLRCKVDRVEVHDLENDTFYATIHVQRADGSGFAVDARPSDAIALALRAGAAILVAEKVIAKAKSVDLRASTGSSPPAECIDLSGGEVPPELLANLGSGAFGKWKM
jgi:bifunctional DNase/RNase